VKVRIVNEPDSDHPMQHPIHFHGQRFLVLARDGVRNPNLAWKDTELVGTGQTTDILVEMSNPGTWMVHCHIAEHLEGGMMFSFEVEEVGPRIRR
ncbi:MAG: multicopper oxidase domain-containing protein, partial [Rubrobacteraceae bacterium]